MTLILFEIFKNRLTNTKLIKDSTYIIVIKFPKIRGGIRMDTSALNQFIVPEALIMVPTLYFIGLFLRQTPKIPFWTHVWIKLTFSVIACMIYFGPSIKSFVQGILVTGAAVLFKDIVHRTDSPPQSKKEEKN